MLVKVWNDNTYPFSQTFKDGVTHKIGPKQAIEIEYDEAMRLLKSYNPMIPDYDNKPLPSSYKMLRIDEADLKRVRDLHQNKAKSGTYLCQACGYVAANTWELNGHVLDQHKEQLADVEAAQTQIATDDTKKPKGK